MLKVGRLALLVFAVSVIDKVLIKHHAAFFLIQKSIDTDTDQWLSPLQLHPMSCPLISDWTTLVAAPFLHQWRIRIPA